MFKPNGLNLLCLLSLHQVSGKKLSFPFNRPDSVCTGKQLFYIGNYRDRENSTLFAFKKNVHNLIMADKLFSFPQSQLVILSLVDFTNLWKSLTIFWFYLCGYINCNFISVFLIHVQ